MFQRGHQSEKVGAFSMLGLYRAIFMQFLRRYQPMANRIKGITVEIGGDTTKLQTALKGVNSQIKNTQSVLKDVEKLLKLDPTNINLLTQKQKLLTQAIGDTKEKLATLKVAAQQANEQLQKGEISQSQYDALQREIAETEAELKKLESQLQRPIKH